MEFLFFQLTDFDLLTDRIVASDMLLRLRQKRQIILETNRTQNIKQTTFRKCS